MSCRCKLVAVNRGRSKSVPGLKTRSKTLSKQTDGCPMTHYVRQRIKNGLTYLPYLPDILYPVLDAIGDAFETYIIGGYVRDIYMNRVPNDIDLLVKAWHPTKILQFLSQFGEVKYIHPGKGFIEWIISGYKIDVSVISETENVIDNLETRDITINAMVCRLHKDARYFSVVLNPLFYISDIDAKVIRMMNPHAFSSDPIFGFRAIRFATTHECKIE